MSKSGLRIIADHDRHRLLARWESIYSALATRGTHQKRRTGKGERWPALNSLPCRCSSSSGIPAAGIVALPPRSSSRWSACCPGGSRRSSAIRCAARTCPGCCAGSPGLYGLCIRLTPWLWWSFWRTSNSPLGLRLLRRTIMAPVYGSVERAVEASRPALIVAFHPMTADPAVRARRLTGTPGAGHHRRHRPGDRAPVLGGRGRRPGGGAVRGGRGAVRQGRHAGRPVRAARAAGRGRVLPPAARRGAAARAQARTRAPR